MEARNDTMIPPTEPLPGSLDRTKLWLLGLGIDEAGAVVGPGLRRYSFWADCECPDDCTRDHQNE